MRARLFALPALLLLAAAAPAAKPSVAGIWYEEATYPDGTLVISIADLRPDGTYTATFRHCLPQGQQDRVQVGHWSYANGMMHLTKEYEPYHFVYATEDYQTESFDGHVWTYKLVKSSDPFAVGPGEFRDTLVAPGAKVPDCNATS